MAKFGQSRRDTMTFYRIKDSFITQDRNEHFEGGTHEATFSRGHSSLTGGTISKNWVSYERYGYFLSTDTRWVVEGQMVWSEQPCKVSHFSGKFKIAEKLAFFMSSGTFFCTPFFKMLSFRDKTRYWLQTNFKWSQISWWTGYIYYFSSILELNLGPD